MYHAPLFARESLDPLTRRAEPLWSRDDTIMSYPSRAKGAEHASQRANHLRPGSWPAKAHSRHMYLRSLLIVDRVLSRPRVHCSILRVRLAPKIVSAWRSLEVTSVSN